MLYNVYVIRGYCFIPKRSFKNFEFSIIELTCAIGLNAMPSETMIKLHDLFRLKPFN